MQRELRNCLGKFATGVMIACGLDKETNQPFGLTINSFASVSLNPPLVSFCIGSESSNLELFKRNQNFSLNILSENQIKLAKEFALAHNSSKWQTEDYYFGEFASPIFKNSLAFLECKIFKIIEAGDHQVIIGEVVDFDKLNSDKKPLIYYSSTFSSIAS